MGTRWVRYPVSLPVSSLAFPLAVMLTLSTLSPFSADVVRLDMGEKGENGENENIIIHDTSYQRIMEKIIM